MREAQLKREAAETRHGSSLQPDQSVIGRDGVGAQVHQSYQRKLSLPSIHETRALHHENLGELTILIQYA